MAVRSVVVADVNVREHASVEHDLAGAEGDDQVDVLADQLDSFKIVDRIGGHGQRPAEGGQGLWRESLDQACLRREVDAGRIGA